MGEGATGLQVVFGFIVLGLLFAGHTWWDNHKAKQNAEHGAPEQLLGKVLTDIDIPFGRLVLILTKIGFAAIPAIFLIYAGILLAQYIFFIVLGIHF